jgi:hypothetical protein
MFPLDFVSQVIEKYSRPGQSVLDPFAGRGSSIYIAATRGRLGAGIEINPVGWLFGKVKLSPAPESLVVERLKDIALIKRKQKRDISSRSKEFFDLCFSKPVQHFLINARDGLKWRSSKIDASLMAIILVYLHGKKAASLSNQLRQGKAMSPEYSVRWWKEGHHKPPDIEPVDFLEKRIRWRYAKGIPSTSRSFMLLGDSTVKLKMIYRWAIEKKLPKFSLLFTSPPYNDITNYYYDQWLRLWMLGGPDYPISAGNYNKGKFGNRDLYKSLLEKTFHECAKIMKKNAIIYIRTDARLFTFASTLNVLLKSFPKKTIELLPKPYLKKTQTFLFGDHEVKPGEIDIIMQ